MPTEPAELQSLYQTIKSGVTADDRSYSSITVNDVADALKDIKLGKRDGKYSLSSDHLATVTLSQVTHCFSPLMLLHVSDAHGSRSWLDHVLTTHSSHSSISDMEVKYDCVSSDHLPLCFSIYVKLLPSSEATIQEQIHAPHPVLNAVSPQDLHNYHTQTGLLLSAIDVPHEVLRCTNPNCNDEAHRTLLSNLYNIIKSLKDAAEAIPTKANNTSSKYTVLGWNDLVRDSHQAARESFLFWRSAGSPRHGPLYDIMKIRRAHFKRNKTM